MKRIILLSIILLISLLFFRAHSYAGENWLASEASSLSPLNGQVRKFLEYATIEEMRASLGEGSSGLEAATSIELSDSSGIFGGNDDGVCGSEGCEAGGIRIEEVVFGDDEHGDGLAGTYGLPDVPDGPSISPDAQDLKEAPPVPEPAPAPEPDPDPPQPPKSGPIWDDEL
ncbi:MAG: hypothetical protein FJZ10_00005 [Candidatus Omnitrophica bacterium]|nr:hypothetical protein [Candidatus Omnitrophota bacterium]